MALLKCSECGRDVSSKAPACPHCGCPVEAQEEASETGSSQPTSTTGSSLPTESPFVATQTPEEPARIGVLSALIGWVCGSLFLLASLGGFAESAILGIMYVSIAILLLPPVRRATYGVTRISLSGKVRAILVIVLLCVSGWEIGVAGQKQAEAEKQRNTESARQMEDERKKAEAAKIELLKKTYETDKVAILDGIRKDIENGKFSDAIKTASTYAAIGASEAKSLLDEAKAKKKEVDREAEIKKLKTDLAGLEQAGTNVDKIVSKYARLIELVPDDPQFATKHEEYSAKQRKLQITEALRTIKETPESNTKKMLALYNRLVELDPDKKKYRRYRDKYKKSYDKVLAREAEKRAAELREKQRQEEAARLAKLIKYESDTNITAKEFTWIICQKDNIKASLVDPKSAEFRNVLISRVKGAPAVLGEINSKNRLGGYTGFRRFFVAEHLQAIEGENMSFYEFNKLWDIFVP